jgi:hypothetical protein
MTGKLTVVLYIIQTMPSHVVFPNSGLVAKADQDVAKVANRYLDARFGTGVYLYPLRVTVALLYGSVVCTYTLRHRDSC